MLFPLSIQILRVQVLGRLCFIVLTVAQSNILIDSGPTARICDFGLSDIISTASMSVGTPPTGGTHRWMAPELFTPGQQSMKETDIYSFGMVAYEVSATIISRLEVARN